jgi:hypothetical protein
MKPVIGKSPTVFHRGPGISIEPCPRVTELYINCPVEVSIKSRNRYEVIESAEIELTNDNRLSWKGHEARSYELEFWGSTQMVDKRLDEILDRTYEFVFEIPVDDYLKKWYNSYCATNVYAKVRLTVRRSTCEVNLGIIKR